MSVFALAGSGIIVPSSCPMNRISATSERCIDSATSAVPPRPAAIAVLISGTPSAVMTSRLNIACSIMLASSASAIRWAWAR